MQQVNFYMMVGLPASGKTTRADLIYKKEKFVGKGAVKVSTDEIREKIAKDINDQSINSVVFDFAQAIILSNLYAGRSVIFDATNLKISNRVDLMKRIEPIKKVVGIKSICIAMDTPLNICKERNSERDRVVPVEVLERMYKTANFPPVFSEGWDEVITVSVKGGEE